MLIAYTSVYICVGMYIRLVCYTPKYTILLYTLNFAIYYTLLYYVYIDELKAFGISEEDLFRCRVTDKYKLFMKFQIQRARDYYNLAKKGAFVCEYVVYMYMVWCLYVFVHIRMCIPCYYSMFILCILSYYTCYHTYKHVYIHVYTLFLLCVLIYYTCISHARIYILIFYIQVSPCSPPTVDSPYKLHSTYTPLYSTS